MSVHHGKALIAGDIALGAICGTAATILGLQSTVWFIDTIAIAYLICALLLFKRARQEIMRTKESL